MVLNPKYIFDVFGFNTLCLITDSLLSGSEKHVLPFSFKVMSVHFKCFQNPHVSMTFGPLCLEKVSGL